METFIEVQGLTLVYGAAAGLILGFVYVATAFIRDTVGAGILLTAVTDTVFGIITAVFVFTFLFVFNHGIIRIYIITAILSGMLIPVSVYRYLRKRIIRKKTSRHTDIATDTELSKAE